MKLRNILILAFVLVAATAVWFVTRPPDEPPPPRPKPREYVWLFEMDELSRIVIELPHLDKSEAFIKHEDRQFYFDDPPGDRVDPARWGGGIPLILSGPAAERPIAKDATEEQLAAFGFTQPLMKLTLTRDSGDVVRIEVGDEVPDGHAHYVKLAESNDVYIVDVTWYEVLERIVMEPPYWADAPEEEESD